MIKAYLLTLTILIATTIIAPAAKAQPPQKDLWKITFYCGCAKCINNPANRDGLTASGFPLTTEVNIAANNFLPFGTRIEIEGLEGEYIICDRGSKKYFGRPEDKIKHIDIYIANNHEKALSMGTVYREVKIIDEPTI